MLYFLSTNQLCQQLMQAVDCLDHGSSRTLPTEVLPSSGAGGVTVQSACTASNTCPLPTKSSGSQLLLQGQPSVPRPASIYTGPNVDTSIHSAPSSSRATFMQPSLSPSLLWDSKNRKRSASTTYRKGGNKYECIPTWTHTFVC